jgi:hypothetical protein
MAHSKFVTFVKNSLFCLAFFLTISFSNSSFANDDCTFGGAGKVLQFSAGSTEYDYATVNPYLYSCIDSFKDAYVNAGMEIPIKKELKNETDLKRMTNGLSKGLYTQSTSKTPNQDKTALENASRFARKIKASCTKDRNYIASVNSSDPINFSSDVETFISYCYNIGLLDSINLTLSDSKTLLDPNKISDVVLRKYYTQCESTEAPALACKAVCDSNSIPLEFKERGCSQFSNIYGSSALLGLATECVPYRETNPNHESCQKLCNAQASSCLDGLTANKDSSGDANSDDAAADDKTAENDNPSADTTDPTLSKDDTNKLSDVAKNLANNLFGNSSNGMNGNGSNNIREITSPTNSVGSKLNASSMDPSNTFGSSDFGTQAANNLPSSVQLPLNTRGEPGGVKKGNGSPGGGGPRMGGSGNGSFGATGSGSGSGKGSSRGGRRYGTKNTRAEDIDLNRFLGTTGNSSGGGGASGLSQKLKEQINQNKKKDGVGNANKINAAFQNGLNRGTANSNGLFEEQFFPEAEAAYEYIRNSEELPNEKGHL